MKLSITTSILAIGMMAGASINVSAKHGRKVKNANFKLLEAYTQRMLPGQPGAPPPTTNHFIIIWQAETYPETFFWRGENGFLPCDMQKAHKISKKDAKKFPANMDYNQEFVKGDQIHKGDTLELTPVTRGKFAIPADIPKTAKNTLFFKTGGTGWQMFKVTSITTKKDVPMP